MSSQNLEPRIITSSMKFQILLLYLVEMISHRKRIELKQILTSPAQVRHFARSTTVALVKGINNN